MIDRLQRLAQTLAGASGGVPVFPVVVPDRGGTPQLPAITWARDGGTTQPLMEEGTIERPVVLVTVYHGDFLEAARIRERLLAALLDAGVLAVPPDPPSDDFVFDLVTTTGPSGVGVFAVQMAVPLGAD